MARLHPEPVPTPTGPQIDPQQLTLIAERYGLATARTAYDAAQRQEGSPWNEEVRLSELIWERNGNVPDKSCELWPFPVNGAGLR